MNPATVLTLTRKGTDEVAHRTHRLAIRMRCVLLLLQKPRPVTELLQKLAIPADEVILVINSLLQHEFVRVGEAADRTADVEGDWNAETAIGDGILLSEAKFLLIDFCVDCFGTRSQKYAEEIRKCQSAERFRQLVGELYSRSKEFGPSGVFAFQETIRRISETRL